MARRFRVVKELARRNFFRCFASFDSAMTAPTALRSSDLDYLRLASAITGCIGVHGAVELM